MKEETKEIIYSIIIILLFLGAIIFGLSYHYNFYNQQINKLTESFCKEQGYNKVTDFYRTMGEKIFFLECNNNYRFKLEYINQEYYKDKWGWDDINKPKEPYIKIKEVLK